MSAAEVAVAAFEDPPPLHAATISDMAARETMAPDLILRTDCLLDTDAVNSPVADRQPASFTIARLMPAYSSSD
jgi:hypothetical protein